MSGNQSKEHKELVIKMGKLFKAEETKVRCNGHHTHKKYFPDLITKEEDIEIEFCPKVSTLLDKSKKWNPNRKKILIIGFFDEVYNLFDEVYFYKNQLRKLK